MITAQVETARTVTEELKPLFPAHREELALFKDRMPLDPDYDEYTRKELCGQLIVVTLREDGKIIGYWVSFVAPSMHYRVLTCVMDILYVAPEHRQKGAGFMLADKVKQELIRRGVKVWWAGSKCHKEIGWFLERLGFKKAEELYVMWLGEQDA